MECRNSKIGKLKRLDIDELRRDTGLVIDGVYKNNTEKYDWTCKEGHNFNNSIACMKMQVYDMCKICDMILFAKTLNLTSVRVDLEKPIWRCNNCLNEFSATKMSLACKKTKICKFC